MSEQRKATISRIVRVPASDGSGDFEAYLAAPSTCKGPGIVLLQEIFGVNSAIREVADLYAEEGYVVLAPDLFWRQKPGVQLGYTPADFQQALSYLEDFDFDNGIDDIKATMAVLRQQPEFAGQIGVIGFCMGGKLAYLAAARTDCKVAVSYYGVGIEQALHEAKNIRGRLVVHIPENDAFCPPQARADITLALEGRDEFEVYVYPDCDHAFARKGGDHFNPPASLLAHQRSVAAFRGEMGPHFNLSSLWDQHVEHEFTTRDVNATMATMVPEPYVNHIPTMTGGVGYKMLKRFYSYHFIHNNPPDTVTITLSRTVGASQIVDEQLFCCTHTREIDWLLPGIKPTGRKIEIPMVAIVSFRGDKLYHEHIYWDQASVLVQIGLLDPEGLPVAGVETARKLVDETLPSNSLMPTWANSEGL